MASQEYHWHYTELDDRNFQIRGRTLFFIVIILSVVFLVILFFIYARWVCRFSHHHHHHHHHNNNSPTTSNVPQAPQSLSLPQGLDPTAISTLPIILHGSESTNGDKEEGECCICLGVFEVGDKVKILPKCQHSYHCECVDTWLSTRSSCPLCRNSLRVVDSVLLSVVSTQ